MLRKTVAVVFLLLFLSFTGLLIYSAFKPETLPVGTAMPELPYIAESGQTRLQPDSSLHTMLVFFHTECEYYQYELNVFDESLHKFENARIMLLTPEQDFFTQQKMVSWPALANSARVLWGMVDAKQFGKRFGSKSFPTTDVFDPQGVLRSKIYGEAKLEKVLSELEKSRWYGHQISRHN